MFFFPLSKNAQKPTKSRTDNCILEYKCICLPFIVICFLIKYRTTNVSAVAMSPLHLHIYKRLLLMKAIRCVYKPGLHNISVICHHYSIPMHNIHVTENCLNCSSIQRTVHSRYVFGKSDGASLPWMASTHGHAGG